MGETLHHPAPPALTNEPRVGAQARLVVVPGAARQGLEGGLAVGVEIGQPGPGCKEQEGEGRDYTAGPGTEQLSSKEQHFKKIKARKEDKWDRDLNEIWTQEVQLLVSPPVAPACRRVTGKGGVPACRWVPHWGRAPERGTLVPPSFTAPHPPQPFPSAARLAEHTINSTTSFGRAAPGIITRL